MSEGDAFGMQIESIRFLASIEVVAKNRIAKSLLVGAVHTQLVGTARLRIESHAGMTVGIAEVLYLCHRRFPSFFVNHLVRAV